CRGGNGDADGSGNVPGTGNDEFAVVLEAAVGEEFVDGAEGPLAAAAHLLGQGGSRDRFWMGCDVFEGAIHEDRWLPCFAFGCRVCGGPGGAGAAVGGGEAVGVAVGGGGAGWGGGEGFGGGGAAGGGAPPGG